MNRREAGRSAEPPPDDSDTARWDCGFCEGTGLPRRACVHDRTGVAGGAEAPLRSRVRVADGLWECFLECMNGRLHSWWSWVGVCVLGFLCLGCETYGKADWKARVGHYTWDQAIEELGPPESEAKTSDGSRVADWVISRSRTYSTAVRGPMFWSWSGQDVTTTAESHLLLTFDAQGRLKAWKRIYK